MRIGLVTPARPRSLNGNRVTALRWSRVLRGLGHKVAIRCAYEGEPFDLLVALHARRSFASIERFARERDGRPLVVALTGTDLYSDIRGSKEALRSLELASRLVLLQPLGIQALPRQLRGKARVIHQSATRPPGRFRPRPDAFEVCLLCHMRAVKDPFRGAEATRRLPPTSRIRLLHVGAPLEEGAAERAREESAANPRYRWLGELPRWKALRVLARSRLLLLTSRLEGGANAVSEALATGVPVISSRIPGSEGILGKDYPGFFPVEDAGSLARLLHRAESDGAFYATLKKRCRRLAPLVDPRREIASWAHLLREVSRVVCRP